ncbi:unnamed protein product [Tenebrio molitor]|uniref:Lipase n=1 Tax=Tenebrio molitor TaxID=7067 RepID=A0A8J6HVJ4_TENMO|nr:hypothetical protein GEV33_002160 [Tenebrio molitor]CAH1378619.1 unnamed protein product [Tenebrio molitor]
MLPKLFLVLCSSIALSTTFNPSNNACTKLRDYPIKAVSKNCFVNPNVKSRTPKIIVQNRYPFEAYNVTTTDGYKLQLFRIPPRENDNRTNKQPVFLEHGIFVDSANWVYIGERSLAFVLADQGYDVWLANQRGTRYSREHTKLKDSDHKYWLYSLDDLAQYDVPAALDLIANVTGKAGSIVYMGHSRGSTVIFMYASSNPVHARRMLKGIVAFSPIAYFDFVWYLKGLSKLGPLIGKVFLFFNITVVNRHMEILISLLQVLCGYVPHLCRFGLTLSSGRTVHFLPEDLLAFYSHFPSSIATMQLTQYSQMSVSNKFQKYDYGKEKNLKKYGQAEPPLYNLSNIIVPLVMYYGKHDILIKEPQVQRINDEIGGAVKLYKSVPIGVEEDKLQYGHNDFIWAGDLDKSLYPHLLESLKNHMSSN